MAIRFTAEKVNFLLEKFYLADFVLRDNLDKTKSYAFLSKRFNSFISVVYSRCKKFSVPVSECWQRDLDFNITKYLDYIKYIGLWRFISPRIYSPYQVI